MKKFRQYLDEQLAHAPNVEGPWQDAVEVMLDTLAEEIEKLKEQQEAMDRSIDNILDIFEDVNYSTDLQEREITRLDTLTQRVERLEVHHKQV